jgi:hypothetical protein
MIPPIVNPTGLFQAIVDRTNPLIQAKLEEELLQLREKTRHDIRMNQLEEIRLELEIRKQQRIDSNMSRRNVRLRFIKIHQKIHSHKTLIMGTIQHSN